MAISIKKAKGRIRVGKASQSLRTNDRVQIRRATGKLKVQKPKLTVSAKVAVTPKKSPVIIKRGGIQIAKRSPVLIDYAMRSKMTAMAGEATSKKNAVYVTARTPYQPRPTGVKQTSKVQIQKANPRAQARGPSKQSAVQIVTPQKLTIQKNTATKKPVENERGNKQIHRDKMNVRLGNRPKPSVSNIGVDKKLQKGEQLKEPQFYVSLKTAHAAPKLHPSLKPVDKSKPLLIVSARKQKLEQERKRKQVQKHHLTQKQLSERRRLALERDRLEQDRMDQREKARQQARIAQKKRMLEQLEMRRAKQQAAAAAETKTASQTKTPPSRKKNNPPVSLLSRALKKATKQQPDVSDVSKDSSSKPAKKQTKRKLDSPNSHEGSKALRSAKQKVATTNLKISSPAAITDKKTSGRAKSAVKITVKPKSASSGVPNNQARRPTPVKKNAREPSQPGITVVTKTSQVKVGQKTASPKAISKIANKTGTPGVKIAKKLMSSSSPSHSRLSSKKNTSAAAASKNGSDKQKSPALAARKRSASTTTATNTIPTKPKQTPKRKRGPTSSATAGKARALTDPFYQMSERLISFQSKTGAC